ncbi:hypothetical protein [Pseudonocardia humida]|uniref:Uncharacterized protein n=1 Tax=Pseudonocardia humida TaxID=2800819 RepID=A0ABT1A840_9PSEU|nr:hypothetical protein [Pseudonocardia humida]MCO1659188.1 hypothetical protein [Pseudonocardia humida]
MTNVVAARNESRRHFETRKLAHLAERRTRSADVFRELQSAIHEIEWLTWFALVDARAITLKMLDDYDIAMHRTLANLMGASTSLAAVDANAYELIQPKIREVYDLEWELAKRTIKVRLAAWITPEDEAELKKFALEATRIGEEIPTMLASAMRDIESD